MKKRTIKIFLFFITTFILAAISLSPTFAVNPRPPSSPQERLNRQRTAGSLNLTPEQRSLFVQSGIIFYNPSSNSCLTVGSNSLNLGDDERASYIAGALANAGYDNNAILGVLGNLQAEAYGFDPTLLEGATPNGRYPSNALIDVNDTFRAINSSGTKTYKGGLGIAQWTYIDRVIKLQEHADGLRLPVASLEAQTSFLLVELSDPYYKSAQEELNSLSLEEAVYQVWVWYERPGASSDPIKFQSDSKSVADVLALSPDNAQFKSFNQRLNFAKELAGIEPSDGFASSSGSGSCDTGDGQCATAIVDTAIRLAWPDTNHFSEVYPPFEEAANAAGRSFNRKGDCGEFVSVVMQSSVDPNFPNINTPDIRDYLIKHTELYMPIENLGNSSNLQPGDIFVYNYGVGLGGNGHTFIYLGDQPGVAGNVASASWSSTGRTSRTGYISNGNAVTFKSGSNTEYTPYMIFRYIGGECNDGNFSGAIGEAIQQFEASNQGVKAGIAAAAIGGTTATDNVWGSWTGGRAWSTIKVPLAIAANNASSGTLSGAGYGGCSTSGSVSSAITGAITKSDNCDAWNLWKYLGGDSQIAAAAVNNVLRAGKDSSTSVTATSGDNNSTLTSGQTNWSLANQATFAANITSTPNYQNTFTHMGSRAGGDATAGLKSISGARAKGGWSGGGFSTEDTITRQFGIIPVGNGKCSAVAIGVQGAGKGNAFGDLTTLANILKNNLSSLPSGPCPPGM